MSLKNCIAKANSGKAEVFSANEIKQLEALHLKAMKDGVSVDDAARNAVQELLDEAISAQRTISDAIASSLGFEIPEQGIKKISKFARNKIFTEDKVAAARALLKKKLGTLNSGIDPEFFTAGVTIAGAHVESGVRSFTAYSKAMIEDFGNEIKPYLRSFYEGVRNYPGIEKQGMTPAAELDIAEQNEKNVDRESESPAIGKVSAQKPRATPPQFGHAILKDDYGVSDINGYDNETGEGASGAIKTQFLKDTKKYLESVAAVLTERGYHAHEDKKGKLTKPVSVNESGIAGSGDVTLTMLAANSGNGIYITIGDSAMRGMAPSTKSGICVMMRGATQQDRYGGHGTNRWMPVNLTAGELANKADNLVSEMTSMPDLRAKSFQDGKDAFAAGKPRNPPRDLVIKDIEAANRYTNGWDAANLDAPLDSDNNGAQSDTIGGENNGLTRALPSERISTGNAEVNPRIGTTWSGVGESLDAGMAGQSEGTHSGGRVSGSVSDATSTGDRGGNKSSLSKPIELGEKGSAGDDGSLPDTGLDHSISEDDALGKGGIAKKFSDNVAAIKLLKAIEAESRAATPEERKTMARYVGFGGMAAAFDPANKQWAKQHEELKSLLTEAEFSAARETVNNAYFTNKTIVDPMFKGLARLGFNGGRLLEPSVGSGNFFGMMPQAMRNNSSLFGVELDSLTSRLAKAIYPKANIAVATGFQEYQVPAGFFDVAMGNPPFGEEPIVDKERSPYSGHSIHNYFIARMIDKVRDGGIVPVVVSRSFMDALNPRTRAWIAQRANLIGAVRLPSSAFKETAGTEVITDILFFQKTSNPLQNQAWVNSSDVDVYNAKTGDTIAVGINDYFQKSPKNVLGKGIAITTQHGNSYSVEGTGNLTEQLNTFIESLPEGIFTPIERTTDELDSVDNTIPDGIKQGSYFVDKNGSVKQRGNDVAGNQTSIKWVPKNETAIQRMKGMIKLRDLLRTQMRMERIGDATIKDIEAHRRMLDKEYDAFKKKFGFVNDQTNRLLFLDDTEAPLLQMLEFNYDKGVSEAVAKSNDMEPREKSATKADILTRRVLFPQAETMNVTSAKDALLASLDAHGKVDIPYMAKVYGKTQTEIVAELGELIYQDPAIADGVQSGYVMADEYLAGDVKTKLEEAKKAASENRAYKVNVAALEKVIPVDKLPSEIFASVGASWIPASVYNSFAKVLTGSDSVNFGYIKATAQWDAAAPIGTDIGKMYADFGARDQTKTGFSYELSSFDLLRLVMNGRTPEIKQTIDEGGGKRRIITNEDATEVVRSKAEKIKEEWQKWLWADGTRSDQLSSIYNEKHNRIVNRKYDGSHLVLHGSVVKMRQHQIDAIWRMVQDRNALLDHVVGAGKTFAMCGAAMEMKRLGIARKPMFVVPNHLTMQWRTEFAKMYPGANVLAATPDDFSKSNRQRMFSKIALGDYDAVIIGHSSLSKVAMDKSTENEIINEQLKEITDAIEELKRGRGDKGIVGSMEKIKRNLEAKIEKMKEKTGNKDNVVTLEDLGVDGLFVDEMHEFKNLFFTTQRTRVAGLGNPTGSGKAFDMFVKVRWLQKTFGNKVPLITATGTPVSNSLAEMFTMQRYMKYDEMKREGLHLFDAWSGLYGDIENVYEIAPSGVGYRSSQRFSKFKNLPSLIANYRTFADTVTLQDLKDQSAAAGDKFPVPKIQGNRPQIIIAPRSEYQTKYFGVPYLKRNENTNQVVYEINIDTAKVDEGKDGRFILSDGSKSESYPSKEEAELALAEKVLTPVMVLDPQSLLGKFANLRQLTRETKGKINALSLTSLASKAGLDMRIINPSVPDFADSKINKAVGKMMDIYKQWNADKGTQLVFCDSSIPNSARASMASKDRRLFVRNENGELIHKNGTVNTIEEYEGLPFYLVKMDKTKTRAASTDIYEPVSGKLFKSGFSNKAEAKVWMASAMVNDDLREEFIVARDSMPEITQDEISEYRDAKELEVEDDGSNEVSLSDLESVSGATKFSVYDDIKSKLVAKGVPEREIAFIHDYESPAKKDALFKAVKAGSIRFLFGSTPKLGAGTNVQDLLVGLHHIDAPWRPSDLEQREGRIIRQGNLLYKRDPDNFEIFIGRYATEMTYDTRRWQILEHKASGIEQLRKYDGALEIDDVAGEAANSADMKAAASGNPLVLEETKLRNEVKRLTSLRAGHADGLYAMQRKINDNESRITKYIPSKIEELSEKKSKADANPLPDKSAKNAIADIVIDGKRYEKKDEADAAIARLVRSLRSSLDPQERSIQYRGLKFRLASGGITDASVWILATESQFDMLGNSYKPGEEVSPSGLITRFNNFIENLTDKIEYYEADIKRLQSENESLNQRIDTPFAEQPLLDKAAANHVIVKRKLMKATQLDAVKEDDRAEFFTELDARKDKLRKMGLGDQVRELDANDEIKFSRSDEVNIRGIDGEFRHGHNATYGELETIRKAIEKAYKTIELGEGGIKQSGLPNANELQALASAFQKRAIGIIPKDASKVLKLNGVALTETLPDVIFLNPFSSRPHMAVIGHELVHHMRRKNPELYARFEKAVRPYIKNNYHEYATDLTKLGYKGDDVILEEFMADIVGDGFMKKKFWQALANSNRSLLQSIVKIVHDLLMKAAKGLGYTNKTEPYLRDFNEVMDIAASVMAEYGLDPKSVMGDMSFVAEAKMAQNNPRAGIPTTWQVPSLEEIGGRTPYNKLDDPKVYADALESWEKYDDRYGARNLADYRNAVDDLHANGGKLYRIVFVENAKDISLDLDKNFYWSIDRYTALDNADSFGLRGHIKGIDNRHAFIIEATVPKYAVENMGVDISGNPEEKEVNIIAGAKVALKAFEITNKSIGKDITSQTKPSIGNGDSDPDIRFNMQSGTMPNAMHGSLPLATTANPKHSIPDETEFQHRQRQVQDKMNRFKVLQDWVKEQGVPLTDKSDVHTIENLMHSKVANRTEDFRERTIAPLIERAAKSGFNLVDIADYLEAQHIPEANARIAMLHKDESKTANGITTAEANAAVAEFEAMPNFQTFKAIADEFQKVGEVTLALRLGEGLISREQYDAYKATFKNWVPLRGDGTGKRQSVGKGLSVNAKEKRRLGHGAREDGEHIIENLLLDRERAIYQIEHNRVVKSIIQFALEAQQPDLITVNKPVKRQVLKESSAYEVQYKGRMMRAFSSESDAKAFINQSIALTAQNPGGGMGRSNFAIEHSYDPTVIMQASPLLAENEIQGYVAGHTIRIQLNDELLARAATNMGVDQLNMLLSAARSINTGLSKIYTAYSPDFILRNAIRDGIAGTINLTGDHGLKMAAKIYTAYPRAIRELLKARNDPRLSDMVQRYRAAGGNTGAAYLSDIERVGKDATKVLREHMETTKLYKEIYAKRIAEGRNAVWAHTSAAMTTGLSKYGSIPLIGHFLTLIEHLNAVTENALRLATFTTLASNGYSEQTAALAAKNSTVNFNRKGEISNVAGSLYLFFNPAVQGSARMFSTLLRSENKVQAQALSGMLAMAAFTLAEIARGYGDDDDEEAKWKAIPDYVKDHNMIFMAGDIQITVPVPYEFAPFHALGTAISDAYHGESYWKASSRVFKSLLNNLMPMGDPYTGDTADGVNFNQIEPTLMKMAMAPRMNENTFGAPIQPEKNQYTQNKPDSQNMFRGTKGTVYSGAAEWVNSATGGDQYHAGGVDVSPEVLRYWVTSLTGGAGRFVVDSIGSTYGLTQGVSPEIKSVPIARVLVREAGVNDSRSRFWEAAKEAKLSADAFAMAKKARDAGSAIKIKDSELDMILLSKMADKFGKAAAAKRDAIDVIRMDDSIILDSKQEQIKAIENEEQAYYDKFLKMFDARKK